jgi:hypothetical protein
MLAAMFGGEWAEDFVHNFLFSMSERSEESSPAAGMAFMGGGPPQQRSGGQPQQHKQQRQPPAQAQQRKVKQDVESKEVLSSIRR